MKIYKCNLCGKTELMTNIKFSSGPYLLRTKSYDNRNVRMFIYVGAEYEEEYYDTLREMGISKFYDIDEEVAVLHDVYPDEKIREERKGNVGFDLELLDGKDESFIICDQCKKIVSTRILRHAITRDISKQRKVILENDISQSEMVLQQILEEALSNGKISKADLDNLSDEEYDDVEPEVKPKKPKKSNNKNKKPRGRPRKYPKD